MSSSLIFMSSLPISSNKLAPVSENPANQAVSMPKHGLIDEVDGIVAAWRTARPDLDSSPLHVFSRISRLARRLELFRKEAFSEHGIDSWQFEVLSTLRKAPQLTMTAGQIMQETLVSSGTMTNRIDRLVASGFVERLPEENDRRVVNVRLLEAGAQVVDNAMAALLLRENQLLAVLPAEEATQLAILLRKLGYPLEH